MDLTLLESSIAMPGLPSQGCDDLMSNLVEIGDLASWSLSSAKVSLNYVCNCEICFSQGMEYSN